MIKTLRITSVVAAILAGVLIKFFVLPMLSNVSGDPGVGKVLDSPGVIDRFKETKGAHAKSTGTKTSPLVQQAIAYARILNPAPKPKPPISGGSRVAKGPTLGPTTPKFQVFATTYFEGNPELSQALIDEPGKGRYWVRQSSMVGHLLIEQVKDGVVIVKNSEETFELEVEKASKTSLIKGKPTTSRATGGASSYRRPSSSSGKTPNSSVKTSPVRTPTVRTPSRAVPARSSAMASEKADELVSRLKDLQRSARSDTTNSGLSGEERAARIGELLKKFQSPGTSGGGAKTPSATSNKLAGSQDPNRISAGPPSGKIQAGSSKSVGSIAK